MEKTKMNIYSKTLLPNDIYNLFKHNIKITHLIPDDNRSAEYYFYDNEQERIYTKKYKLYILANNIDDAYNILNNLTTREQKYIMLHFLDLQRRSVFSKYLNGVYKYNGLTLHKKMLSVLLTL